MWKQNVERSPEHLSAPNQAPWTHTPLPSPWDFCALARAVIVWTLAAHSKTLCASVIWIGVRAVAIEEEIPRVSLRSLKISKIHKSFKFCKKIYSYISCHLITYLKDCLWSQYLWSQIFEATLKKGGGKEKEHLLETIILLLRNPLLTVMKPRLGKQWHIREVTEKPDEWGLNPRPIPGRCQGPLCRRLSEKMTLSSQKTALYFALWSRATPNHRQVGTCAGLSGDGEEERELRMESTPSS